MPLSLAINTCARLRGSKGPNLVEIFWRIEIRDHPKLEFGSFELRAGVTSDKIVFCAVTAREMIMDLDSCEYAAAKSQENGSDKDFSHFISVPLID